MSLQALTVDCSKQWQTVSPISRCNHQGPGAFTVMARVLWSSPRDLSSVLSMVSTSTTCDSSDLCSVSVYLRQFAAVTRSHGCLYTCSCTNPLTISHPAIPRSASSDDAELQTTQALNKLKSKYSRPVAQFDLLKKPNPLRFSRLLNKEATNP